MINLNFLIANDLLVTGEKMKIEEQLKNYESYKTACVFYKIKNRFSQLKFFRKSWNWTYTQRNKRTRSENIVYKKKC